MILFSSIKLERALADDSLTSWIKAKYMIMVIILYSFSGPIYEITPSFGPKPPEWRLLLSVLSTLLLILLTYSGAMKCYSINKEIDDNDFTSRLATLFVPMTFKFIAVMMPLMAVAALIAVLPGFGDKEVKKNLLICLAYASESEGYRFATGLKLKGR